MWSEQVQDLELQRILLQEINEKLKQQKSEYEKHYRETTLRQIPNVVMLYQQIAKSDRQQMYLQIFLAVTSLAIISFTMSYFMPQDHTQNSQLDSFFIIENLRGDKIGINTHLTLDDSKVAVRIINNAGLDDSVINAAKSAIISDKHVELDGKVTHKTPAGQMSTYYLGWSGALNSIDKPTKHIVPKSFVFSESGNEKITIEFVRYHNPDGYDGMTRSFLSQDQSSIEKSHITIYNANEKSASQIETIILHEFGHALGLKHSSDPDDLMASSITTAYPFISQCAVEGLFYLYDGIANEEYRCES